MFPGVKLFSQAKSMVHFILGRRTSGAMDMPGYITRTRIFTMTMTCVQLVLIAGLQGHTIAYVKCIV